MQITWPKDNGITLLDQCVSFNKSDLYKSIGSFPANILRNVDLPVPCEPIAPITLNDVLESDSAS